MNLTPAPSALVSLLVWLGAGFLGLSDGCLRRSEPLTDKDIDEMEEFASSTPSPSHKQPCFPWEEQKTQCLNGGKCYAIELHMGRDFNCHCPSGWMGQRCQYRRIDPIILGIQNDQMHTANIAAGVSVCILVVFMLLLAAYVYLRYHRKARLLQNREFEATSEQLYRRPFCHRNSIVESLSRPGSIRRTRMDEANVNGENIPHNVGIEVESQQDSQLDSRSASSPDQSHAAERTPTNHNTGRTSPV